MSVLEAAVAVWLGGGLLAFCAWTVRVFVTTEPGPRADVTTQLVWRTGQACIWVAAVLLAGGLAGAAARTIWRLAGR